MLWLTTNKDNADKKSNFNKCLFMYIYYKKKQSLQHSQRYTLLRKMAKNIHGNVIHIANLLTSIEDKKL